MKKLLTSHPGVREIYAYNKFVKSLPKANFDKDLAQEIITWSKVYNPSDQLEQYVPNSEKYNSILAKKQAYEYAQNRLKEYNYSKY